MNTNFEAQFFYSRLFSLQVDLHKKTDTLFTKWLLCLNFKHRPDVCYKPTDDRPIWRQHKNPLGTGLVIKVRICAFPSPRLLIFLNDLAQKSLMGLLKQRIKMDLWWRSEIAQRSLNLDVQSRLTKLYPSIISSFLMHYRLKNRFHSR